ncbi:MAG: NADH-quinone oxidoreductase subunit F [Gemmatimonadetes bacterium]|nr:NADH-quinone oxidoreductase subunit F [Gemmatimonadota bacterium]
MAGKKQPGPGLQVRATPRGREVDARALAEVRRAIGDLPHRPDLLIEHLHRLQDTFGCLSTPHLTALAAELSMALAEVYEVATFYHHFDVVKDGDAPPPPVTIRVCESLSCELAGAKALLKQLAERHPHVRVIPAPCVGRCERAPVAVVGRNPVDRADPERVERLLEAGQLEASVPPAIRYGEYRSTGGYQLLAACVTGRLKEAQVEVVVMESGEEDVEEVVGEVDAAGLRGLGGAGFPVAKKWALVRQEPKPRVVVLNADEGEPGTFKDRWCLENDPHRVLEGLLLAAWAVEADDVFIYLRDEYAGIRTLLTEELAALRADPPCALPAIHLRRGAGAYICGEESALIESIEGKRGEPRLRPPFPAQAGVFGRPTLVQNVETMYWLREIIEGGADSFAKAGCYDRTGKRLFSVSGRVRRPGVYAVCNGVTLRQLVNDYAGGMQPGHELYGYLPGGASGGMLPASLADLPLDFDVLAHHGCFIGSAAVIVLSTQDRALDAARNVAHFFASESCGKCTPCRAGTAKSEVLMRAPRWNLPVLLDLADVMNDASICGLGQAAPNALRSVLRHFAKELES